MKLLRNDGLKYFSKIKNNEIELITTRVVGNVRRIRATYQYELAEEVLAYHGLGAERELIAILSDHIAQEIDNELVNSLRNMFKVSSGFRILGIKPMENKWCFKILKKYIKYGY